MLKQIKDIFEKFEFGITKPITCRVEEASKNINAKILYISDIHLGVSHSEKVCRQIINTISQIEMDIILIGGDLVDSRKGIRSVKPFIKSLSRFAKVGVIPGNHDLNSGIKLIREGVIDSGAIWLCDTPLFVKGRNGDPFTIIGELDHYNKSDSYTIYCTHDPSIFPLCVERGVNLTLAGHLHGGQFILYKSEGINYPGYFFNKWTRDSYRAGDSMLIVSRGVTELIPIRYNCPREVVLCHI